MEAAEFSKQKTESETLLSLGKPRTVTDAIEFGLPPARANDFNGSRFECSS